MDKTSLNLISIVLGATGLLVVLTKFNVPELNMSFFGINPFAIKRDAIESVMAWIFTVLALVALFIQVGVAIFSDQIQERTHTTSWYILVFIISLAVATALVILLTMMGNGIARRFWLPQIVDNQREIYQLSKFMIEHDGWREDQLPVKDKLQNPEYYRATNFKAATGNIEQIEKLLDISPGKGDLKERLDRVRIYFERQ